MIFALIVFLLVVIFFAFFIGKNLTNVCTFWFFKTFTELPVSVLVLIAFGVGIVFSILVFVIAKVKQSSYKEITVPKKEKPAKAKEKIEKKERKIRKNKQEVIKTPSAESTEAPAPADNKQ